MLKTNTIDVARESEKGIVELETLKKVNDDLISTIDETLKIQKEGQARRLAAEQELLKIEDTLKQSLLKSIGQGQTYVAPAAVDKQGAYTPEPSQDNSNIESLLTKKIVDAEITDEN